MRAFFSSLTRWAVAVLVAVTALFGPTGSVRAPPSQDDGNREAAQSQETGVAPALQTISVGAFDASGAPILGLTAADFLVREDGIDRQIAFVEMHAETPLDIALVLDVSSSMRGFPWRQKTLDFLQRLSPQRDCVLLMRFSETVSQSVWARPDDPALAAAAIEQDSYRITPTMLFDALTEGIRQLFPHLAAGGSETAPAAGEMEAGGASETRCRNSGADDHGNSASLRRQVVIVITDGMDNRSSRVDMYRFELATQAISVPIFQIELGEGWFLRRDFQALVRSTGGDVSRTGSNAYQRLLSWLRDFYSVGYHITATGQESGPFEYTRHEVEVEVSGRRATTLHRPVVYRAAFDSIRAASELDEGVRLLQSQRLEAALAAFDRSIAAHPYRAAPYAYRARTLLSAGDVESALESALRASELEPANGERHVLVSKMAQMAGRHDLAWTHAILAAQAGSAASELFEDLAASSAQPADLRARLEAPRVVVLAAPPSQPDLIVRAALPRAIRSIQRALSRSTEVALVADISVAQYVVWVAEREMSDKLPRRFKGRVMLADRSAGDGLYEKDFTLDDLDDPVETAADLAEHIEKILEKVTRRD